MRLELRDDDLLLVTGGSGGSRASPPGVLRLQLLDGREERLEREASLIPLPGNQDSPSILLGSEWYTLGSALRDAAGEVLPARVVGIEPDALRVRLEAADGSPEPTVELR